VPGDPTRPEILPAALSGVDRAFLFPVFNVVDGFFESARQADLQHVVLLSSAAITYSTPGWISEQHLQLERAVAASGLPWTYVRPDAFMTNDPAWKHQIVNGQHRQARPGDLGRRGGLADQRPARGRDRRRRGRRTAL